MKIELVAYTITWVLSCVIIRLDYNKYRKKSGFLPIDIDRINVYARKIHITTILLISFIWVAFNMFITHLHPDMGSDWRIYVLNFSGLSETPSLGLSLMIRLVHAMGGSIYTLSRLSTFICMTITLIAYKYSEDASPRCFVFLFLTEYAYLTISLLKQTFCNAIASLFFVLIIQQKTKKSTIISILLMILACTFHPSGYILIPMFLIMRQPKTVKNIAFYTLALVFLSLFFKPVMLVLGKFLSPVVPFLGNKIMEYFNEETITNSEKSLTFIKSLPELCVVLLGIYKRKQLVHRLENYDNYLLVAITGWFFYLMSIYNVWMYRMIYLFHLTIFIFFDLLLRNLKLSSNRMIISSTVATMLGVIMYRFLYISFA